MLIALISAAQISGCAQKLSSSARGPQGAATATPPIPAPVAPAPAVAPPSPPESKVPAPSPAEVATTEGRTKVALLVPLSGANASIGRAMLDAGNMALFDVSGDVALLPRDTGSAPEIARVAAERAVADKAALILGPVFSTSVLPVHGATQATDINVITFSTDTSVAGGNVFVLGFLPAQQVDRVIAFARSRGMTKLAALVPDNAYGVAISTEISALRDRLAMPPPRILTMDRAPRAQIESLGQDPPEMLLLALGGEQLRALGDSLAALKAAHPLIQFLGTGLWDDPAVAEVRAMAGAWYAATLPGGFSAFDGRFMQTYNYHPPRIASLAYDAVALAAAIAKGADGNPRPFTRDVLLQPSGFLGMDGAFRFLPSGLSERNLAVLSVAADGPQVVDPPPSSFEILGQ